jgi:hypothetical protein
MVTGWKRELGGSRLTTERGSPERGEAMPLQRAFAAGHFMLELDGADAGWLASADGGQAVADVVEEKPGADQVVHKHLANVKYTDIQLGFGAGASKTLYDWIADTLGRKYLRKNGALVTADFDFKERERLTFTGALISHIDFPVLDASSKDTAKMTLGLAPEQTKRAKGSGAKLAGQVGAKAAKWASANFRLQIDGLDCTGVSRIDSISIRSVVAENAVGELREVEKEPSHLEISDLMITLSEAKAETFYDWHEDFVIKGNNGEDKEKSGTLELLSPTKDVLFTLSFSGLGIYKVAPMAQPAGVEAVRRVTASMYCEQVGFTPGPGA